MIFSFSVFPHNDIEVSSKKMVMRGSSSGMETRHDERGAGFVVVVATTSQKRKKIFPLSTQLCQEGPDIAHDHDHLR